MRCFNPEAVVLIGYAVYASDDCAAVEDRNSPVQCYKCTTHDNPNCADPFNDSKIEVITCRGACTKWVQKPKFGPKHIVRTCSADYLNLNIHYSYVCMQESRPGDGTLCFCHRDLCNTASSHRSNNNRLSHVFLAFILACIAMVLARWHPHQSYIQKYATETSSSSSSSSFSSCNSTNVNDIQISKDESVIMKRQERDTVDGVVLNEIYRTRKLNFKYGNPQKDYNAQSVKDNTDIK